MFTKSLWNEFADETDFPGLNQDIAVDTAVIGGGITGVSLAKELSEAGQEVAVLEAQKVGGGTTSHSTGNLYSTVDKNLGSLSSKYDPGVVAKVVESRSQAIDKIEENVQAYDIDCDFARRTFYLYSALGKNDSKVETELKTALDIDLPFSETNGNDIPFPVTKGIEISGQAQLNPMRYVQGLANNIHSEQCRIYEHTHVNNVERVDDHLELETAKHRVTAENVVHATHTPKGIKLVHTLLGPYREYGIACRLKDKAHPEGIFWGYFDKMEKYSTRIYERNDQLFLIIVGKPHKVGQAGNNEQHINDLKNFAHHYFQIEDTVYQWGGQHYRPADKLPYIGQDQLDSNVYMATGYSTDGLVYGTLAGMILSDQIVGKENKWSNLYKATRHQPMKAAKKFLKENLDVGKEYLKKLPGLSSHSKVSDINPGEGKIIEIDGEKVAAHKTEDGKLQFLSPVCTHMGCDVNWNNAEQTWDCPCHASRFRTDGSVLEGPAYEPLKKIYSLD